MLSYDGRATNELSDSIYALPLSGEEPSIIPLAIWVRSTAGRLQIKKRFCTRSMYSSRAGMGIDSDAEGWKSRNGSLSSAESFILKHRISSNEAGISGQALRTEAAISGATFALRHKACITASMIQLGLTTEGFAVFTSTPTVAASSPKAVAKSSITQALRSGSVLTCHCEFPPELIRVRPIRGRTNEEAEIYGRADYRGAA